MENPFETSVEVLPAATMTPAPKPAFEAAFADILTAAKAQVEQSKKIIVTDPTDVDGIKQSREYRLALRKLRTTGENKRKELKEDILRAGRALDGMQAILEQVCTTEEKRLLAQEEIAERIAAERAAKLRADREAMLVELGENPAFWGPFERFPAEDWDSRIAGVRAVKEAQAAQAKREAEEAARKAKEDAEERARVLAENARLKAEADAREAAMKAEREAAEKAIRIEREEAEKAIRTERARAKEIEDAARAEAAKLAYERKQAEEESRAKEEAEREAKRKAEAAPDRIKLLVFAQSVQDMRIPAMASECACKIGNEIAAKQAGFAAWIRGKAGEL